MTNRASPSLASHAPSERIIKHILLNEVAQNIMISGVSKTKLNIIPSSISSVISRCDCCKISAKIAINGISCRIDNREFIDLRFRICLRLTRSLLQY
jgi:hypothetical protein